MTQLLPQRPPKQLRSHRTLERIARASFEILDEEGPDALTVHAVIARARSSVGSFYARFSGRNELLAYLGERAWREAAARWDEAREASGLDDMTWPGVVHGTVRLLGEAVRARATHLNALRRSPDAGDAAWAAFQDHVMRTVERPLLARAAEMAHPDPEVGVRLGLRAVLAMLDEPVGESEAGPIPLEVRIGEAARLLTAYLAGGGSGEERPGQVEFFDIWG